MSMVILRLPNVKRKSEVRPKACPYCHGETFQCWGMVTKPVKDNRHRTVGVYSYRCCQGRHTFRHFLQGVNRADQMLGLRKLATLCWALGFSYRSIEAVFAAFGFTLSRMTMWREGAQRELHHPGSHGGLIDAQFASQDEDTRRFWIG